MFEMRNDYESLIIYVEEVRDSLLLLHNYMDCVPDLNELTSYLDLITQHQQNFALLNLVIHRLDNLIGENYKLIDKYAEGEE